MFHREKAIIQYFELQLELELSFELFIGSKVGQILNYP